MHPQDVRVVEAGQESGLVEEALGGDRGRQLGPEDLDRHVPVEDGVPRQEHGAHPSTAELPLNHVVGRQGRA
jgi:hypothetical protein